MKKLLLFAAIICFAFSAEAQSTTYKAFKVDVDFGYAVPSSGAGTKAGVTFTIEPHYRLSDDIAVGLRIEGAGLGYENQSTGDTNVKIALLTSYCLTGDYYFTKGSFRAFGGAGAGIFTQKSAYANSNGDSSTSLVDGATRFGVFPRVGFELSHLRVSAAYDIVGSSSNYLAFTVGFFFGGGKK